MNNFNLMSWMIIFVICVAVFPDRGTCAKLYVLEDHSQNKAAPLTRLKRQTHPAATIAKLPTQDNNPFIPIVGPTQALNHQQSFLQNAEPFSNTLEFPSGAASAPDTLVDYLVPPSPSSQISSLNFQDPAANLENIDNVFDVTSAPFSSTNNLNSFQSFANAFPSSPPNFQSQLNFPNAPATQSATSNDQVQSISFQNSPISPSATPSLVSSPQSSSSLSQPSASANIFLSNKISNSNREPNFLVNQFPPFPSQILPQLNFARNEQQQQQQQQQLQQERPNQGKWDLGYDANEILAPPRDEIGRISEYDTINVSKFRRPNPSPPSQNADPTSGQIQHPATQFGATSLFPPTASAPSSAAQFPQFSPFPPSNFLAQNEPFGPVNGGQFGGPLSNQIATPNSQFPRENAVNDQSNIVWGTQKQSANFNPTTNAPFLPTVPPNVNSPQPNNANALGNAFNGGVVANQQQPQFQPQPPNGNPFQAHNQNFPIETPLTSQFDAFLPQGTVSDHTFPALTDGIRHFQKRQANEEEEEEEDRNEYQNHDPERETEPDSRPKFKNGGVYSFVKTDKNGHFKWSVRHPSRR